MRIAFLGLGRMGRELAAHLLTDEYELTVWNRSPGAADELVSRGATAAPTAARAVEGAEMVITALFGPRTVREVVIDAVLPIPRGAVWVDVTTVSPDDAADFLNWAIRRGIGYVHSPVVGSLAPARAGALGVLLGGDAGPVAVATPVVSRWADPDRLKVYDTPGKAATGKLVANLAVGIAMQGLVEALRLGHSGGLSTEEVLGALDRTLLTTIKDLKGDFIRGGRFEETEFSAALLGKDAGLMVHTSRFPLPAITAVYEALDAARRAGRGEDDFAVIAERDR